MGSRMREDEKNEATIRRLLKLPENKRCINCNSLGPQYVCTTFSTFVCTPCSGVHREFSHRIKSVSMAKFTAAEVSALQAGGNERARQTFFRDMDPVRNPPPDSGSPDKLRDFIKRVYVERRYSGDRPPKARQDETALELRRPDPKGDRSPDLRSLSFEDRMADMQSPRGRKSDADRNAMDQKRSPSKFEPPGRPTRHSYDERDGRAEEQSPKDNTREKRSLSRPFSFRDFDTNPPPAQSITELLGDVPGLRVEIYKHPNGNTADLPPWSQGSSGDARKTLQSQSFGAVGSDRVMPVAQAHKRISSASLIDLNGEADPAGNSRGVADPFMDTAQGAPTTSNSWATFNLAPTPPAPPGYPAPQSDAGQWAQTGWGRGAASLDAWSDFATPSPPPRPAQAVSTQEPHNGVLPGGLQSSPGATPRQRREIPPDFFVPSFEDGKIPNLDMRRRQQIMQPVFHPPQLDPTMEAYYALGGLPGNPHAQLPQVQLQPQQHQQTQVQALPPTARSRNPFDDDGDDEPTAMLDTATSMQFPSMDTLQAALPPTLPGHSEVSAMEAGQATAPQTLPMTNAAPDWSYSFTQFHQSTSPSGNYNFGGDQTQSPFQMSTFMMQPDASGAFMPTHPFAQEVPSSYPGTQFYTQNVVRPAGGNPFG